jgi:hypothetical protein
MIIYSVTIVIQAGIESEWVDWMNNIHVPDVLRTGCFSECRFYKVLGSENDASGRHDCKHRLMNSRDSLIPSPSLSLRYARGWAVYPVASQLPVFNLGS